MEKTGLEVLEGVGEWGEWGGVWVRGVGVGGRWEGGEISENFPRNFGKLQGNFREIFGDPKTGKVIL